MKREQALLIAKLVPLFAEHLEPVEGDGEVQHYKYINQQSDVTLAEAIGTSTSNVIHIRNLLRGPLVKGHAGVVGKFDARMMEVEAQLLDIKKSVSQLTGDFEHLCKVHMQTEELLNKLMLELGVKMPQPKTAENVVKFTSGTTNTSGGTPANGGYTTT